jgi:hypothetical protein
MTKRPAYADLHGLSEDDRIAAIAAPVLAHGLTVGFIVDDWPGKADRYKRKLAARFPEVVILETRPGPVPETTMVHVGPKRH